MCLGCCIDRERNQCVFAESDDTDASQQGSNTRLKQGKLAQIGCQGVVD